MENIQRLAYHCSKVEAESRYVMKSFLSIPLITYFIRGRDPTSRYLEGLQRPEFVCLSLVRKVHLDLLEELFLIDHENLESSMTFVTQERKDIPSARVRGFVYRQWLKIPVKVTGQRRYFL